MLSEATNAHDNVVISIRAHSNGLISRRRKSNEGLYIFMRCDAMRNIPLERNRREGEKRKMIWVFVLRKVAKPLVEVAIEGAKEV